MCGQSPIGSTDVDRQFGHRTGESPAKVPPHSHELLLTGLLNSSTHL